MAGSTKRQPLLLSITYNRCRPLSDEIAILEDYAARGRIQSDENSAHTFFAGLQRICCIQAKLFVCPGAFDLWRWHECHTTNPALIPLIRTAVLCPISTAACAGRTNRSNVLYDRSRPGIFISYKNSHVPKKLLWVVKLNFDDDDNDEPGEKSLKNITCTVSSAALDPRQ